MVGVPKSKRCSFCKSRKTKCDEKWPNCGTCTRAGKICSGPRTDHKFIVNGCHGGVPNDAGDARHTRRLPLESGCTSKVDSISRHHADAVVLATKHLFVDESTHKGRQVAANLSKPLSWNPPDKVTAHLIACLGAAPGTGYDLHILGAFLPLIPRHLGSGHTALSYAVELLLGAWENSRQGLPSELWLDLRAYNRALRSLKATLDDANSEHLTNTLATLCVLQKTEILYDFTRGSNQENHAAGLIAVIKGGGPRQPMEEMALHVTFESIFHMLQEDIRQRRESDFHNPEWMKALHGAVDASGVTPVLKHLYHLWVDATVWPGLARLVSLIRRHPSDTMTAAQLHLRATALANLLRNQDETILAALEDVGAISEVENKNRPDLFPKCYQFADFPTAKLFSTHTLFSILAYRFLQEADQVLCSHRDPYLEAQARKFSKRAWMAYPWLQSQIPLAVDFTGCLVFSYEAGNEEERRFCAAGLTEMDSSRHPPPIGQWVEATIMANAKAYTGRLPFIKTQDSTVEYEGVGCRS